MPASKPALAPINFKNHKLRGEWAELRFMARAAEQGLMVSKPWGDSAPYDLMVDRQGRVHRIQIKSTDYKCETLYKCHITSNGVPYSKEDVDFIAAYVIPVDTWYIIPIGDLINRIHLRVNPGSKKSKYERYKEAWHLLL